ncbi:uncharacterized protein TRAVEDRAFT_74860, partial [Trametes versicolor FP-101664 SS1]|uniref:uncharacterized protein n=1 Tax=Trametes versicolor (strain FP-101664) TaxID=717944 RepID=UPI00046222FF
EPRLFVRGGRYQLRHSAHVPRRAPPTRILRTPRERRLLDRAHRQPQADQAHRGRPAAPVPCAARPPAALARGARGRAIRGRDGRVDAPGERVRVLNIQPPLSEQVVALAQDDAAERGGRGGDG